MTLAGRDDIVAAYSGEERAAGYVAARFGSELNRLLHDRQVSAVQQAVDSVAPGSSLEIAAGPARLTRDLHPAGMLACLEYSEAMIDVGREVCAGTATWLRADAFFLPFGESFDLVYSFRLLRHFRRADRDRLYAEIRRVLRPGGFFLMDAVNERLSRPLREAHPAQYLIYDKLYRADELRTELGTAGFDTVRLEPVQKCYRWQYASQVLLGPRANLLNRLVIRGLERLPRPDGLEWIVTCRRG